MYSKEKYIVLVKTYTKDLFAYAITRVQLKELAEDLVQDALLAAYQSYNNFKGKSSEKTWLLSILKHKIADHYRSKYRSGAAVSSVMDNLFFNENDRWKPEYRPADWGNEKALLDDPEFTRALKGCFDALPQKWSSVMQLKYLEERDAEGICTNLEITKANFWQIIHRAKLQLRNCLELKWFN